MRVRLTLFVTKIIRFILVKMGRGGSLPGSIALKLCPTILSYLSYPDVVVMVTGTNGKTTTSNMVNEVLSKKYGKVIGNRKGDNLKEGITTLLLANTSFSLRVKADAIVMEVDELNVPKVMKDVKVSHFIINNFFRDQLDRAGEMETIVSRIETALQNYDGIVLLNGDDPNVARLGYHKRNALYFGVDRCATSVETTQEASEGKFCFHCNAPLVYDYYQYSHIGSFHCPSCDFGQFEYAVKATQIDVLSYRFEVDKVVFKAPQDALYSLYNCMAVIALSKCLSIPLETTSAVLESFELKDGRMERFDIGKDCLLNLVKNPTGANEVMKYIQRDQEDKDIIMVLNDNDQDGTDISWIWDANFELIMDDHVKHIICSGKRAYDMALRFKYSGYQGEIVVKESMQEAVDTLVSMPNHAYVIATYTALQPMRAILRKVKS